MKGTGLRWKRLWRTYRCGTLLLLFGALALLFYELEQLIVPKYWMVSALDAKIPFIPEFVIPYLAWFAFIGVGLGVLLLLDRETFVPTVLLLCAGMGAALLIFVLFPNGQPLRPRYVGRGACAWLVKNLIYANDTNTNCCPSIHVLNQLAICLGLCRSRVLAGRPNVRTGLWIFSALVCMSTVFIKQHSIVDVIVAMALFYPLHRAFFPTPVRERLTAMPSEY